MEIEKDTDLPRNLVKKIVKNKVSQVQASTGAQQGRDVQVNKDALLAFSESAKVLCTFMMRSGLSSHVHRRITPIMACILLCCKKIRRYQLDDEKALHK